ncbi:hypothetical protein FRC15_008486, partial [Serendipita sp. 397]
FFISGGRYLIIEDFGPWPFVTTSIETFLVMMVPSFVAGVISITFSCKQFIPRHSVTRLSLLRSFLLQLLACKTIAPDTG